MIVNGNEIIEKQLSIEKETRVDFDEKNHTVLNPVRFTPEPEDSRLSLDGEWQVKYYPFKEKDISESTKTWKNLQQPGKVFYADPEAEGKPIPNWNRVTLEHIDENDGAILRRVAEIPKNWKGKRIFLRFDSVYPAGVFYLNGKKLGAHYSGLTPVEFDVTGQVESGKIAEVAVRLIRKHKFVKMDMPRHALEFAGLAQSAYFFAVEKTFVKEYKDFLTANAANLDNVLKKELVRQIKNQGVVDSIFGKTPVQTPQAPGTPPSLRRQCQTARPTHPPWRRRRSTARTM